MFKLISLELRKQRFARYIGYAAMIDLALLLFLVLLGVTDHGAVDYVYSTFHASFTLIDTFVKAIFIIFAGALLSRMIVGEYRNKKLGFLFTYPIKRYKFITAKLVIIYFFTFAMILFTNILISSIFVAMNDVYPFISDSLTGEQIRGMIMKYIVSSLSAAAMALIPLAFGMFKHSITMTMGSSVILVLIVCSGFNGPLLSLNSTIEVHLLLGAAGLLASWLSMLRLEKKDVK
ncbi:hypothetical protein Q5741_00090 [Paenibacillus sp. JX-17]|uniref:ABC transporter permease n=1 Tax=Paenibacillus lacisoli TaxID=3064525 RepID=A0ABT9C6C3_9BACL|nr:hypothetical protein [Paenibacillus sp. JX-17]MDO7904807.1 hypothetical protein [Paenibacillus sp. JX-17]